LLTASVSVAASALRCASQRQNDHYHQNAPYRTFTGIPTAKTTWACPRPKSLINFFYPRLSQAWIPVMAGTYDAHFGTPTAHVVGETWSTIATSGSLTVLPSTKNITATCALAKYWHSHHLGPLAKWGPEASVTGAQTSGAYTGITEVVSTEKGTETFSPPWPSYIRRNGVTSITFNTKSDSSTPCIAVVSLWYWN
jgi:hypothetical protein